MPDAIRLPVLAVEDLARPGDCFHCPYLHSNLTAEACLTRQKAARAERRGKSSRPMTARRLRAGRVAMCRACALGESVERQLARVEERPSAAAAP